MIINTNTKKLIIKLPIFASIVMLSGCSILKNNTPHSKYNNAQYTIKEIKQNTKHLSIFASPKNIKNKGGQQKVENELQISNKDHIKLKQVELDAKNGNPQAQWKLGMIYFKGLAGVQENNNIAFSWIRKSASQNYPPAEYILGFFYEHGIGTTKNYITAKMYYKVAQDHGFKINNN